MDADGTVVLERNPDDLFPAASVIKVALVMALYAEAAQGHLALEEKVAVGPAVPGSGVLRLVSGIASLSLGDLARLAIAVSDNTATNVLIDRVGLSRVAEHLKEWGVQRSRLARKMYDLDAQACGRENVMTPRETALLLLRLVRGECVDRETSDAVVALLLECTHDSLLARYLPAGVRLAHKSGWIEGVRNDAGVVWADRAVIAVGFSRGLGPIEEARSLLGLLGWCAYRHAGGHVEPLPPELAQRA
jgi:beta-lactamase class A